MAIPEHIIISRELINSDMYLSEKFTKFQALLDLHFLAATEDTFITVRGIKVNIKKGQIAESEERLAARWKWSRNTVRKFLVEQQNEQQIEQQKSRLISLITIKKNNVLFSSVEQQNEQQNKQQIEQQIEQQKTKIEKPKKEKDPLFEECWVAYRRKGSKAESLEQWNKLSEKNKTKVLPHIQAYVSSRECQYQKDFQRYLRDKTFNDVIVSRGAVIFDPEQGCQEEYKPISDGLSQTWNPHRKCLEFYGYLANLNDGYTDDNRPDGAMVNCELHDWIWSKEKKQWVMQEIQ